MWLFDNKLKNDCIIILTEALHIHAKNILNLVQSEKYV